MDKHWHDSKTRPIRGAVVMKWELYVNSCVSVAVYKDLQIFEVQTKQVFDGLIAISFLLPLPDDFIEMAFCVRT